VKDVFVLSGSGHSGSTSSSLLARLRSQDKDAWNRLVQLYGPLVYSWCRRRGLQAEDAADVLQDVFRSVSGRIKDFKPAPNGSFRGWLWRITCNRLLDFFRRRQRQPSALGGSDAQQRWADLAKAPDATEPGTDASGDLVRRVLALIQPDFSEASWQAFVRVVMEDQQPADVARDLGITPNAVYIAKSRILRRLRDELGEDGV
jgi:RNA polymerase sigma-70 factor, ECF subfamily